ncbi:hypothetical protein AB4Y43_35540 [Paraburkholderia sp. BR10872]|uniref:H-NS family nucleoid-associated regulatory protein n=1 Tax=Paraburkholderia sp. BR10872 TaxID=3236989 RepID=UPI0034D38B83
MAAPKYRAPKTEAAWSGRGRVPTGSRTQRTATGNSFVTDISATPPSRPNDPDRQVAAGR